MGTVLAVLIGLGLAAACGFRVFVPLLIVSIAARSGYLGLAQGMAWLGSTEAVVALSTATIIEIVAYKLPWLDHALDVIASPAAVIAGALVAASQIGIISPSGASGAGGELLMWSSGLIAGGIAGGAVAGITQTASVATRALSTVATAGFANPFINLIQSVLSVIVSVLAIVAPLLVIVVLVLIALVCVRVWNRRRGRASARMAGAG